MTSYARQITLYCSKKSSDCIYSVQKLPPPQLPAVESTSQQHRTAGAFAGPSGGDLHSCLPYCILSYSLKPLLRDASAIVADVTVSLGLMFHITSTAFHATCACCPYVGLFSLSPNSNQFELPHVHNTCALQHRRIRRCANQCNSRLQAYPDQPPDRSRC